MLYMVVLAVALIASVIAPTAALAAVVLLPAAIAPFVRGQSPKLNVLAGVMFAWAIWVPLSVSWSLSPGLSFGYAGVLLCLPMGWIFGGVLQQQGLLNKFLDRALPFLLWWVVVWGLLQGPNTYTGKPQGPFSDPNAYAALINILLVPLLAKYLGCDLRAVVWWKRTLQLALFGGAVFTAFLVASKGAWLSLAMVFAYLAWSVRKSDDVVRKLFLLMAVVLVAYLASWVVLPQSSQAIPQRIAEFVRHGDDPRLMLITSTWLMIKDSPWLGAGLGSFFYLYPRYRLPNEMGSAGIWAHNDYLQLWQEGGLPMLLLLVGLVVMGLMFARRPARADGYFGVERLGYALGVLAIFFHAAVNFIIYLAPVCLLVGVYFSVISGGASPRQETFSRAPRALGLAVGGYGVIIAYLLVGQVGVQSLLYGARDIQLVLARIGTTYPKYSVAHFLSVVNPFHPTPQMVMGFELVDAYYFLGAKDSAIYSAALSRIEAGIERSPCNIGFALSYVSLIEKHDRIGVYWARAQEALGRNLYCNPRHGLSYYYLGLFAAKRGDKKLALQWWRAGIASSMYSTEKFLLVGAISSIVMRQNSLRLTELSARVAEEQKIWEAKLGVKQDQRIWPEMQRRLELVTGMPYAQLLVQAQSMDVDLK
ncbi:MAG: O-antigen ligase family protein [Betaproteobacteria bacterium]|nr:O-antigen ligase family protein [Betaproteobacteria bacterium]